MALDFTPAPAPSYTWDARVPQWTFAYATLAGANLADISQAEDRRIEFKMNQPNVFSCALPLDHPGLPKVLANPHGLIKVYKRGRLAMVAETSSLQVAGEGERRRVNIIGIEAAYVTLGKRFIGQSADGVTYTALDRGEIARRIINTENGRPSGDTKVRPGVITPSSTVTAGPWYMKNALEAITELGQALYGFDVWFLPHDPATAPTGVHSYMNIAPVRGGHRVNSVFEFGTGRRNLRSYDWQVGIGDRITRAISLPPSFPDNALLELIAYEDTVTSGQIGLREAIVENELADAALRSLLVIEHVNVRKNPKNVYTFQPHFDDLTGRVPSLLFDYDIGDIVRGRVDDTGILQLDGLVRVYGADVELDSEGMETVTLTMVQDQ